jgi:hypothetical protein
MTSQYEIFANPQNWEGAMPQGLNPDFSGCFQAPLAAFNANPWKQTDRDRDYDDDDDDRYD